MANDANCMILGEAWAGAARGYSDVLGVTLGTGVGGGVFWPKILRKDGPPYGFLV